jgi:serine phosphatase RsbU (regulator of sigma subunit)
MNLVEAQVAVAKVGKYASSESGDSFEMIERPGGGLSFVLADGQRSGRSAKAISNVVTRKAISLLADGVRDGAAARAASDYLFTYRSGKVLATLNILSIDLQTQTLVSTRNNPAPIIVSQDGRLQMHDDPAEPVGARRGVRPLIVEWPLRPNLTVVVWTDGLSLAGDRVGQPMDVQAAISQLMADGPHEPQRLADQLLQIAVDLDQGRPADDISVLVAAILPRHEDRVRRLSMRLPLNQV